MVGYFLRFGLAVFSVSKHLNRVKKILIVVAVNSVVHVNSDVIFCVNFYDVE